MAEYRSKLESEAMDFLFDAILALKDRDECYKFFEDICTINEIKALEQRLQVARMLKQGRTYLDIASTTGASTATISRVNRSLNYGCDGYKLVFDRLEWK
jgi:TrpR-related protein YerC/YecD